MIADQGVTILAINLDAGEVLVEGPDGEVQSCPCKWFKYGGEATTSFLLAETFAFEVHGLDANLNPVAVRYDGKLEGLGQEIHRNEDGSFGEKPKQAQKLSDRLQRDASRDHLPWVQ